MENVEEKRVEIFNFLLSQVLAIIVHLSFLYIPCSSCFSSLWISFKVPSITLVVVNPEGSLTRLLQMLSTTSSKLQCSSLSKYDIGHFNSEAQISNVYLHACEVEKGQ